MKFLSFSQLFGGKASGRTSERPRKQRKRTGDRSFRRPGASLAVENLEERTLMSVLPAPVAINQVDLIAQVQKSFIGSLSGKHNTPSIIIDPVNSNNLVAVFQADNGGSSSIQAVFSTNAGASWAPFSGSGIIAAVNNTGSLTDPTLANNTQFNQYTNPTVTIDGNEQIYIAYTAHRADNSAGAIVFQKYDFSTGFPTLATPANPDKVHADGVLYEWAAATDAASDPALNPVIVADANLASYTDPQTGATQADPLVDMSINPATGKPRNQGMVYVAWNTNYAAPAPQVRPATFTPNSIKVVASSDGGINFTTQVYANTDGEQPNLSVFGEKASDPQLAVSQSTSTTRSTPVQVASITRTGTTAIVTTQTAHGFLTGDQVTIAGATPPEFDGTFIITVTGATTFTYTMPVNGSTPSSASGTITATKSAVPGGQLNLVYSDFGRSQIRSGTIDNGGTGAVFTSFPAINHIKDAVDPGNSAPEIPSVTLFKQDVSISDPNFTTASDLTVSLNIFHANVGELKIRLLPEAKIKTPFGMAFGPDGNLYVAGNASNDVAVYDGTTGAFIKVFADSSTGISAPDGLAIDTQGNVYVASSGTNQVLRYKPDGTPFPSGSNPNAVFFVPAAGSVPVGLTFGPDQDSDTPTSPIPGQVGVPDLYVTDGGKNQVLVVDAETGLQARILVAANAGGLSSPEGITFGPDGNLYVASTGDNTVKRYTLAGTSKPSGVNAGATYATLPSLRPQGLAFGPDGNLYVGSGGGGTVVRFNGPIHTGPGTAPQEGNFLDNWVSGFDGLSSPHGVIFKPSYSPTLQLDTNQQDVLDLTSQLFVADSANDEVLRFMPVAGVPRPAPSTPTPPAGQTDATLVAPTLNGPSTPHSMLIVPSGGFLSPFNLIVANTGSNLIQVYNASTGAFVSSFANGNGLQSPWGLAAHDFGQGPQLFVSSNANDKILQYDAKTETFVNTFVVQGGGGLSAPTGLAFGPADTNAADADPSPDTIPELYASSSGNNEIMRFDGSSGAPLPITAGNGATFVAAGVGGLVRPMGLTFSPDNKTLFVSSSGNNKILEYDAQTGVFKGVLADATDSPLSSPGDLAFGTDGTLYVTSTGNNRVLRFNVGAGSGTFLGTYMESVVPAANNAVNNGGLDGAYGLAINPDFFDSAIYVTSLNNNKVMRYFGSPAIEDPGTGNSGAVFVFAGGGGSPVTLLDNHITQFASPADVRPGVGIPTGANLGLVGPDNNNLHDVGTTFDQNAPRAINDGNFGGSTAAVPFAAHFRPESGSLGSGGLLSLVGPTVTPAVLNGTWTLEVTDFDSEIANGVDPVQFVANWTMQFTSRLTPNSERLVAKGAAPGNASEAGSTISVGGAAVGSFPNAAAALTSPDRGVGPTPSLAVDRTLGSFSPYQGRLYVVYAGGGANASHIFLSTSDDGGNTWLKTPVKVDDDTAADNFSGGTRPQLIPTAAVDQSTGTLVISFYDARNDAARTRVATYLATSLDGGYTVDALGNIFPDFAPETYVNLQQTAIDAITGKTVLIGPIPDNQGNLVGDTQFDFGDRAGLAVSGGHIYPLWAGNFNAGGSSILTATTTIAGGPRIVSSTQGPVSEGTDPITGLPAPGLTVTDDKIIATDSVQGPPASPPSNFSFSGSNALSSVDNFYTGKTITFTTGPNAGQSRTIGSYTGSSRTFTFDTNWSASPLVGDTFNIIGLTHNFNNLFSADGVQEVNGFIVTFDRPIDVATFDKSNVQVMYRDTATPAGVAPTQVDPTSYVVTPLDGWTTRYGPNKVGAIDPTTGKPILSTTFLVTFAPQAGTGTYSYAVNPTGALVDGSGNPIPIRDKIRSVKSGVAAGTPLPPFTQFPGAAIPPNGTGGQGNPGPTNAPGPNTSPDATLPVQPAGYDLRDTTFSPLTISGVTNGQKITSISVSINISHTAESDLLINLVAPDGTTLTLVNRRGGNQGTTGFAGTTFTTNPADPPISTGTDPFLGTYQPDQPLTQLIGKTVNNGDVWWLVIDDTQQQDTGTLNSWTLQMSTGASAVNQSLGNGMDQNANTVLAEPPTATTLGDAYAVPLPLGGAPFQLPYNPNTLPLIVPGPHVVSTFVPGQPITPDNLVLNNSVSAIDVTFDRNMDPTSFDSIASVLRMMGPAGAISFFKIDPTTGKVILDSVGNPILAPGVYVRPDPNPAPPPGATAGTSYPRLIDGVTSTAADPNASFPRTFQIGLPTRPNSLAQTPGQDLSGTYTLTLAATIRAKARGSQAAGQGDQLDTNLNAGLDVLRGGSPTGPIQADTVQSDLAGGTAFTGTQALSSIDNFYKGKILTFTSGPNQGLSRTIDSYVGSTREFIFTSNPFPSGPNPGDAFHVQLTTPVSASYGGAAVPLPAGKTTTIPITFPKTLANGQNGSFLIQSATVQLDITYPHDPDLEASLVAPDGTVVQLFTNVGANPGSTEANFTNTILDDRGTTPIQRGVPPFNSTVNGNYNPQEPLSRLVGKESSGTWHLVIKNDASSVSGANTLNNWSLTLQEAVADTGLGEPIADQATASFRIFVQDPSNPLAHDTWTAVGPASINGGGSGLNGANSGRIGALAIDPSDPSGNTVYVAGASGGIWKTTNFLTTNPTGPIYVPLTDFGPTFAINIGGIAVFGRNNDPNQSIIFASTGEGDTASQGVGILRSLDGGATWTLLDSSNNVDDPRVGFGNLTPINSASRDHIFSKGGGTTSFKIVVDPTHAPSSPNDVIVYAALSGTNGGLWRSLDSGRHWQKVSSDAVEGTDCTDVVLAANSASQANNNLQVVYAAFRGKGAFESAAQGASLVLMAGGKGNTLILDGSTSPAGTIPVRQPGDTPNGAKGRIVLAAPALTGNPIQDTLYEGWLYAAVVTTSGTLDGLYLTKDGGANWTKVSLPAIVNIVNGVPFKTGIPTNDETTGLQHDPLGGQTGPLPANGNYDISLAIDPSNPSIVYLGGTADSSLTPAGGLIRVDTTLLNDPHKLVPFDNDNADGGQLQAKTLGSAFPTGAVGTYPQETLDDGSLILLKPVPQAYTNLISDPLAPFTVGSTVFVSGMAQQVPNPGFFTNDGQDATYSGFNAVLQGTTDQHRVVAMRDPLTGLTRLIFGDDQGVFTGIDQGNGQLLQSLGDVTNLNSTSGNNPVSGGSNTSQGNVGFVTGSRNGNLQITQFYYGAVQPSILAAEIASAKALQGGLLYGNAQDNGFPVSDPHVLSNGNISWQGLTGDGSGIATDQTGSGTAYSYQFPCCGFDSGATTTNFFLVNPKGTGYVGRTGTGGFSLIQTPNDPQWPLLASSVGGGTRDVVQSNFAVNPINGSDILIGSAAGRIFKTNTQGTLWFQVGFISGDNGATAQNTLDGSMAPALAYGAPDPLDPLGHDDDFMYVGTAAGNLYVSLDGGADFTKLNGGAGNVLDGSAVVSITANPLRGSHDLYAVTTKGVYHITFNVTYPFSGAPVVSGITIANITGGVFGLTTTFDQSGTTNPPVNNTLSFNLAHDPSKPFVTAEMPLQYLTSIVADWRYVIPDSTGSGTHPALYIGGEGGVFRSMDKGKTWTVFPNVANDRAPVDGGYLPDSHITSMQLSVGNISPTTGQPDQANGANLLVVTTYGRGDFAIRLPNNSPFNKISGPVIVSMTPTLTTSASFVTVTFGSVVDPSTFDSTLNPANLSKIRSFTGPNGAITVTAIHDITPVIPGVPDLHNVYEIDFANQTAGGTYTIVIGPNITDFAGNQMDQNGNGINGEDPGDRFTGQFVIVATDDARFVGGLYHDLLNRTPDVGGFISILNPLDAARNSLLPGFARTIITSDEARGHLIASYYTHFLARSASQGEVSGWVQALKNGTTPQQIVAAILGSPEYFQKAAIGQVDSNFVTQLYNDLLARAPDAGGQQNFLNVLANAETAARTSIATLVVGSDEYIAQLLNNPNPAGNAPYGFFPLFLGRQASSGDVAGFQQAFHQGATDESVIATIAGSQEYFNRAGQVRDANNVTVASKFSAANDQFVAALYVQLFGRLVANVSQGEVNNWTSQIGSLGLSGIVSRLTSTDEYRTHLVQNYYTKYVGRTPAAGEAQFWVGALRGGVRDEKLAIALLSSQEYYNNHGGPALSADGAWVNGIYNDALLRPADSNALATHKATLANAEMSARSQVVGALVGSDEYLGDLLDNPNNNTGYYPQVLGRTASAGEVAGWIGVLRQPSPGPGQPNRNEQVLITIVSSPEYFNSQRDPVDPTLTSSRGWLNGLFTNPLVLGRAAGTVTSDAGFNSLLNSLLGDYQPLRVADVTNFVTSGEFRGNLVAADYVAYLHRAASSGDVSQWTGQLNSGLSDEALIQILVSSQEYFNFAQNNAPPFYRNDPNSKYVAQLYQDLLHRPADAGAAFWVNALDAGSMNRSQVAGALLGSSEYLSGVVAGFYNKYLHRNPDNNGFVNAMQHGLRDEQVIEAIVGSSEYFLEAHAVS